MWSTLTPLGRISRGVLASGLWVLDLQAGGMVFCRLWEARRLGAGAWDELRAAVLPPQMGQRTGSDCAVDAVPGDVLVPPTFFLEGRRGVNRYSGYI